MELRFHSRSKDSHTMVVFCMTKACQLMGEHGSERLGIQSRHEPRSGKRCPSPQLVAMRWASVGDPKFCVAYYFDFVNFASFNVRTMCTCYGFQNLCCVLFQFRKLQVSIFVRCVLVMVFFQNLCCVLFRFCKFASFNIRTMCTCYGLNHKYLPICITA